MEHLQLTRAVTEVVRRELEAADMSLREVSRRTGIALSTLASRMRGKTRFNLDELDLIAGLLSLRPSDLVRTGEEEE
ncbi:helix-turn-helix domain-containing protein [Rhodococcus tibetensis]|uniref:Helix-turn-helix domain-containing protein n=1 Tax=Rhodococcus tibetensis TaxID=2965064 RepID=A0ABT1QC87_9NOCA|nr:helix-turn-helix transcriptional regulator [Rhodococcus sp. FXJ9.536]MCQ4119851.1 helix-turn-helix domain-containing protein [Rhodococcus sp. FXJ9.536]